MYKDCILVYPIHLHTVYFQINCHKYCRYALHVKLSITFPYKILTASKKYHSFSITLFLYGSSQFIMCDGEIHKYYYPFAQMFGNKYGISLTLCDCTGKLLYKNAHKHTYTHKLTPAEPSAQDYHQVLKSMRFMLVNKTVQKWMMQMIKYTLSSYGVTCKERKLRSLSN